MAWGYDVTVNTSKLDKYTSEIIGKLEKVVVIGGFNIERRAKEIITQKKIIDTGATRDTTLSRPDQKEPGNKLAREIGPTTDYAPFLEFGSQGRPARTFMGPAAAREARPFNAAVKQVLGEV